ncbi:remodeling and spacing factor 1-like [Halichondria panicea]|uniref:remodeling and spacing factor 1-like n=1 Tax=Halichondria panicea TaxID=6063 RepID=UPI00312B89B4
MEGRVLSKNGPVSISSSPDFAQAYIFIQTFGPLLKLPPVTLSSLENFFEQGCPAGESQLALIHWRLLNTSYRVARVEWQRSAVKCARRHELCGEAVPYHELSAQVRLKLFRLCCEEQFDYNMSFKSELTKEMLEGPFCKPLLGCDSSGQKHWLLKDSSFDVRLYGESQYDVLPPKQAKWVELSRSLEGLIKYITLLESTRGDCLQSASHDNHVAIEQKKEIPKAQITSKKSTKTNHSSPAAWDGDESIEGCIKCRKDNHHSQMLLCDECDRECHTYCQYPRLWKVPKGKWSCPICNEGHLIEELRKVYTDASIAKSYHDKTMEKKERSIARLQRTGLLVQNIILKEDEEDVSRRSRRSRKEINYAELNDVHLPPLGRSDYVGYDWSAPPVTRRNRVGQEYIHDDYLAPRVRNSTRRYRGSPIPEQRADKSVGIESTQDEAIDVTVSASSERVCESVEGQLESFPSSPHQSNGGHSSPSNIHSNTTSENNSLNTCSIINSSLAIDNVESSSLDVLASQSLMTSQTESSLQKSGNNELTMISACDESMDTGTV